MGGGVHFFDFYGPKNNLGVGGVNPSSTRGCKIQRFFESHGGKILGVFDFHGGKIFELKKSCGCKKKIGPRRRPEIFGFFLIFLTSQEVNFLTFQNFTNVRFGPFSNLAGVIFGYFLGGN